MLREEAALETVLALMQVDVAYIQESRLQLRDETNKITQYWAFHHDRPIQGEARVGGHHTCTSFTGIQCYLSNSWNVQCAGEISSDNPTTRTSKNPG